MLTVMAAPHGTKARAGNGLLQFVSSFREQLRLGRGAGAAVRWSREMLAPGVAVIIDTETTDLHGPICDIAAIDAHTGEILLDTLVNPGEPIQPAAAAVHGITDADVASAPRWPTVLPQLLEVTRGRQLVAYNSDYDLGVIREDSRRYGVDPGHVGDPANWACLMTRRSDWLRRSRWFPLLGEHRALGDCYAALELLRSLSQPPRATRRALIEPGAIPG
jgi:DNA polymerase III epsilon subunit-like protein